MNLSMDDAKIVKTVMKCQLYMITGGIKLYR